LKQAYIEKRFSPENKALIADINVTIDTYVRQGFMLSVRQLYYQLVAADKIPNTEQSYKRIAGLINDGRLAGLIDWDAIEDRNRDIVTRSRWESASSLINACASQFHMDMWDNQDRRVFIIVEKAALAGVLQRVSRDFDVPLLAARGYPSVSIVREMALEHVGKAIHVGQSVLLLHLGDHDPSGIDMTRDLEDRFNLFLGHMAGGLEIKRIALNMHQIEEYDPPPNPAKVTDSRFEAYAERFGDESWELDALKPQQLVDLVQGEVEDVLDQDAWEDKQAEIERRREALTKTAAEYAKKDI